MFRRRTPLSSTRKLSRRVVWGVFAVLLIVRFGLLGDYYREFKRRQANEERQQLMGRPQFAGGRWEGRRRRQADLRKPVAPIPTTVYRLEIEVEKEMADRLRGAYWNRGGQQGARPKVKVTVTENGIQYTEVSMNLKGSAGSFRSFDDKPALTLRFSKNRKDQRFHGYSKISLNNSVQDPTYLSEIISRELFQAADVPVPKADHATVVLNGVDRNLYVLLEGSNEDFLSRYFTDLSGNLFDGGFVEDIDQPKDTNSGKNPEDRSALDQVLAACMERDPDRRWTELNKRLDMDEFISFLAMEIMTCHWDGYSMNVNNYRVFHDKSKDRLVFIPHGMDQMFGTFRSSPESDIIPRQLRGVVAQAVLSLPEGLTRYLNRVAQLRATVFREDQLTQRVRELAAKIRPVLAAYGPDLAEEHDESVSQLINRITRRAASITEQLAWYQKQLEASKTSPDTSGATAK